MNGERSTAGSRFPEFLRRLLGGLLLLGCLGMAATRAPDRPLESLVARWAPTPSQFMELDGQLIHLRDEGPRSDPAPLLLIHGTSASLHTWEGWARQLSHSRRVISLDLPGFGLTGPNAQGDYSTPAYVDFIQRLMRQLDLPPAIVVGNSLGGEIAWLLAARHPERVKAVVLIDAGGFDFEPEELPLGFRLARMPGVRHLTRYFLPRAAVTQSLQSVYGDPSKVSATLVDRYFELTLREGNREALIRRFEQLNLGAYLPELARVHQPTLILWGGHDRLIPPRWGDAFAQALPGSRLVRFEQLGHVPQEEDPAATLAALEPWLKALP
jgi:pimeloyl-ACP methyl ester carboxylesterase